MSLGECVYSCRHPLWGGQGTCVPDDNAAVGDRACECDEGFSTVDSFGSPSCVSKKVITCLYMSMVVMGTISTIVFLWHLARHRHMQELARHSPKAVIRRRMLISLSLSAASATGVTSVAIARGGEASMWDGGMFYVYYSFTFPLIMFASVQLVELWLNFLPSQMLSPGSAIAKLKRDGEEKHLFVQMGVSNAVFTALLGPLSMVFRQRHLISVLNISTLFSSPLVIGSIVAVAVHLNGAINKASSQGHRAWHEKAKRAIRRQVYVFFVLFTLFSTACGVLELSEIGRRTPIIPHVVMNVNNTMRNTLINLLAVADDDGSTNCQYACFVGLGGFLISMHISRQATERGPSPAATTRSKFFSTPYSSHRVSGKRSQMVSPRVFSAKQSPLVSPRVFPGKSPHVAKASCKKGDDDACKNGDDSCKTGGDEACKEGGDVAATSTVSTARRASKEQLHGSGGSCKKIVPTLSLANPAA